MALIQIRPSDPALWQRAAEELHHSWPARVPWPSRSCEKRPGFQTAGLPMAHEALNVITILGAIADIHGQCARWLDGKARHHNAVWFGPPLNVD